MTTTGWSNRTLCWTMATWCFSPIEKEARRPVRGSVAGALLAMAVTARGENRTDSDSRPRQRGTDSSSPRSRGHLYLAAISADAIDEGGRLNRELTPASYAFAESHIKTGKLDLCFAWPTPEWVKTVDFLLFRHRWEQLLVNSVHRLHQQRKTGSALSRKQR